MSESRLAALLAISAVIPAGMRLLAGFERSIAPMVNCVILLSDPVGVHDVRAMELVQITVSKKMSGSERNAKSQGTPKNSWVTHTPSTLKSGTRDRHVRETLARPAFASIPAASPTATNAAAAGVSHSDEGFAAAADEAFGDEDVNLVNSLF